MQSGFTLYTPQIRVPHFGRDLSYAPHTAELLVACSGPDLYRVDLSEGRFNEPLRTAAPAVNAVGVAPAHGLVATAGMWWSRAPTRTPGDGNRTVLDMWWWC